MMEETLHFRGDENAIEDLQEWLTKNAPKNTYTLDSKKAQSTLTGRKPLRQAEVFDVILSVFLNVMSSAIYDALKDKIKEYVETKRIEMSDSESKKEEKEESGDTD
jgi:hypothetical protein